MYAKYLERYKTANAIIKMIKSLIFAYLLIMAATTKGFGSPDLHQERTYIGEHDTLRYDLKDFLNFKHTSINFSVNNKRVRVPGLPADGAMKFPISRKISPLVFKSIDDRIFVLDRDGVTLTVFEVVDAQDFREIAFPLTQRLAGLQGFKCSDLAFDLSDGMFALCYATARVRDANTPTQYRLLALNYLAPQDISEVEFSAPYFESPAFKHINPSGQDELKTFVLFDRNVNGRLDAPNGGKFEVLSFRFTQAEYSVPRVEPREEVQKDVDSETRLDEKSTHEVIETLVTATKLSEASLTFEAQTTVKFGEDLFGRAGLVVSNLIIARDEGFELYGAFMEKSAESQYSHFSCSLALQAKNATLLFWDCAVKDEKVLLYFQKEHDYILLDQQQKLAFCTVAGGDCQTGKLGKDWKLKRVLLEDRLGLVLIQTGDTLTLFINDFEKREFVWHKLQDLDAENTFVVKAYRKAEERRFLLSVNADQTLSAFDITVNKVLEISKVDVDQSNKIELQLDGMPILDLEVLVYDRTGPVDARPQQPITAVVRQDLMRLPLPFLGSNLRFGNGQNVKHYNRAYSNLILPKEPVRLFAQKDHLFLFTTNALQIYEMNVQLDPTEMDGQFIRCNMSPKIVMTPMDPYDVTSATVLGEYLVVLRKKSEDSIFVELRTGTLISMSLPSDFKGGEDCKLSHDLLLCKYPVSGKALDTLRLFQVSKAAVAEHPSVSDFVTLLISSKLHNTEQVESVQINSFDFDTHSGQSFTVFYSFFLGGTHQNKVYRFALSAGPLRNIRHSILLSAVSYNDKVNPNSRMFALNNVLVFTGHDPVYHATVYDGTTRYELEYIDTTLVLATATLKSRGLLLHVYEEHRSSQVYMILYRVVADAARQTVQRDTVNGWVKGATAQLLDLGDRVVGIAFCNMGYNCVYSAYALDGPTLYANRLVHRVEVNSRLMSLNIVPQIDDVGVSFVKPHFPANLRNEIPLKDLIRLNGGVEEVKSDVDWVTVLPPFRQVGQDKSLGWINEWIPTKSARFGDSVVFTTDKPEVLLMVRNGEKSFLTIDIPNNANCQELALTHSFVYCLYSSQASNYVAYTGLKKVPIGEHFEVPHASKRLRATPRPDGTSIVAYIDEFSQFVAVYAIDHTELMPTPLVVDRAMTLSDSLHVTDFHVFVDAENRVTLLLLDHTTNRLYTVQLDSVLRRISTLRQSYDLWAFNTQILGFRCGDSQEKDSEVTLRCALFSTTQLFTTTLTRKAKASVSEFTFTIGEPQKFSIDFKIGAAIGETGAIDEIGPDFVVLPDPANGYRHALMHIYDLSAPERHFGYNLDHVNINSRVICGVMGKGKYRVYYVLDSELHERTVEMSDYTLYLRAPPQEELELQLTVKFLNGREERVSLPIQREEDAVEGEVYPMPRLGGAKLVLLILAGLAFIGFLVLLILAFSYRSKRRSREALLQAAPV